MDDAALVRHARDGDADAFAALFRRHEPRLVAIARSMLDDEESARDVVQDTAVVAVTDLDRLREPNLVGSWLAGIVRNLCRRRLRSSARAEWSWESLHGGRLPPDVDATPEEAVVDGEAAASVRRAVAALPGGQRDAARLFYLDGLTYREVGDRLGIEVNAVKARLHRARNSLRPQFTAAGSTSTEPRKEDTMTPTAPQVRLQIRDVRRRVLNGDEQHVVLLQTDAGDRLPIWIGPSEAIALALRLTSTEMPRPLTYDAMANLVAAAGGHVVEVAITRLEERTYHAEAAVEGATGIARADLRPSDALNLALAVDAPIRTNRRVLEDAATASGQHADALKEDFPDDASAIASDITRQWQRHLKRFTRQPRQ